MFARAGADASRVTSNRRLHRLTAFTAVSVLFGISSTVSALASQPEAAPPAAPVAVVTNVDAVEDAALSHAVAGRLAHPVLVVTAVPAKPKAVARSVVATKTVAAKPKAVSRSTSTRTTVRKTVTTSVAATHVVSAKVRTITRYADAPGSQKAIDSCKLVLWTHSPLWLAGHNWCGWQWMAYLPTGSTLRVTSGAAAGTFVVTGHLRLSRQNGSLPHVKADLVLQTCIGSGTGLTLLRRV
jgi:hypothetical protein